MSVTDYGMSNEFTEFITDFIQDELYDYEGTITYGCNLANTLTESIKVDGNYGSFSYQQALDFAYKYSDDAADAFEYYKTELGMPPNLFENPNVYVVLMIIYGVENRLCESPTVDSLWNDEFEITEDIIKKILSDLDIGVDTVE